MRIFFLCLFFLLFTFSSAESTSVKLEDARRSQDKVNIKQVGKDYGILISEGILTLQIRIDYVGGDNPIYVGYAEPDANYGHAKWRIVKITWDANDNPTRVAFADGISTFTKIWNSRTAYDYETDN